MLDISAVAVVMLFCGKQTGKHAVALEGQTHSLLVIWKCLAAISTEFSS